MCIYPCVYFSATTLLHDFAWSLIKTHPSLCSECMAILRATYGGHWRCTLSSHWTGGKAPLRASRVDVHIDRRSPIWQSPMPPFHKHRMCQRWCGAKAQSHVSDSYARWDGAGGEGLGSRRGTGVCLYYYRTQLSVKQSHNRRTGNSQHTSHRWSLEQISQWK